MELSAAIERFMDIKTYGQGIAPSTARKYAYCFKTFKRWARAPRSRGRPPADFIIDMGRRGVGDWQRFTYFKILRQLYRWAWEEDHGLLHTGLSGSAQDRYQTALGRLSWRSLTRGFYDTPISVVNRLFLVDN